MTHATSYFGQLKGNSDETRIQRWNCPLADSYTIFVGLAVCSPLSVCIAGGSENRGQTDRRGEPEEDLSGDTDPESSATPARHQTLPSNE